MATCLRCRCSGLLGVGGRARETVGVGRKDKGKQSVQAGHHEGKRESRYNSNSSTIMDAKISSSTCCSGNTVCPPQSLLDFLRSVLRPRPWFHAVVNSSRLFLSLLSSPEERGPRGGRSPRFNLGWGGQWGRCPGLDVGGGRRWKQDRQDRITSPQG